MYPRAQIFRKTTCTLMMAMYVLFLCFQVNYNLAVASKVRLHQQIANEKHAFSEKLIAKQEHGAVLAKGKTAPTKRFLPKVASFTAQYFISEPVVHVEHLVNFYYSSPFSQEPALTDAPHRGPPSMMIC